MTAIPAPRTEQQRYEPAEGLRAHSAALLRHAERLRAGAVALDWKGPQAEAFRWRIEALADRCATAAAGLARSAEQLDAAARTR
ncbi:MULTISPECIES: hypothetical protein [unclassified Streptomyces]|uniref:Uncharacterized protein n=1 Tax=Streptomyces sp. R33 TaxID=3238629 RepID=A0AB39XYM8_9ACTN|nr:MULTISPECIES: hypothetical protein [unclassified Streptomyces]KOY54883.1 hypothetical protein ADK59_27715 [Streptomyces sp. XY332]TDU74151.1 hypothetical protein EDD91_0788 [Streptomyces sp. KS 21]THA32029.1 hypothetical protein E6W17_34280 [Streptomyces sp. A1547]